jgi:hypothetical protein
MNALILAALASAQPQPDTVVWVKLEAITLKDAERLDGKALVATFTVASAFTWGEGRTCAPSSGRRARRWGGAGGDPQG